MFGLRRGLGCRIGFCLGARLEIGIGVGFVGFFLGFCFWRWNERLWWCCGCYRWKVGGCRKRKRGKKRRRRLLCLCFWLCCRCYCNYGWRRGGQMSVLKSVLRSDLMSDLMSGPSSGTLRPALALALALVPVRGALCSDGTLRLRGSGGRRCPLRRRRT